MFGWNDPTGTLLSDRGWTFDSRPSGLFGEPRRPDAVAVTAAGVTPPLREEPFKEIDHNPGWYAGASWDDASRWHVELERYDNQADPSAHHEDYFAWRTRLARKPKCRSLWNPCGGTCSSRRRRNSMASSVRVRRRWPRW